MAAPLVHLRLIHTRGRSGPPVQSEASFCPVCRLSLDDGLDWGPLQCERCRADIHEPCYWRSRPLPEWVAFVHRLRDVADDDPVGSVICSRCRA
jgi:hypothetical protein